MTIMTKMKGVATAFSFAALMSVGGASLASAEDVTLTKAAPIPVPMSTSDGSRSR